MKLTRFNRLRDKSILIEMNMKSIFIFQEEIDNFDYKLYNTWRHARPNHENSGRGTFTRHYSVLYSEFQDHSRSSFKYFF